MSKKLLAAALCALSFAMFGCSNSGQPGPSSPGAPASGAASSGAQQLTIAVVPKGTTHDYWKSVEAGANQAGKELGVQIDWKGPLQESDRAAQIQIVQQFVSDKVSGIVLAPNDEVALAGSVKSATAAGIPVVIIDSAVQGTAGTDFASFVATDNYKGGVMGGEQLAKILGGKGKVLLLRYQQGSASTDDRERGFLDVMKKNPGIKLLVDNRYGGATVSESKSSAMEMVDYLNQADGIFCPNESTTHGMLLALRQEHLAGKVKFVGFDATPDLVAALKAGELNALISQNPVKMGYDGVKLCVEKLRGQTIPTRDDTGVMEIDMTNINTPDVQKLLAPPPS
jgi:ribose transport system substrate-binding protein